MGKNKWIIYNYINIGTSLVYQSLIKYKKEYYMVINKKSTTISTTMSFIKLMFRLKVNLLRPRITKWNIFCSSFWRERGSHYCTCERWWKRRGRRNSGWKNNWGKYEWDCGCTEETIRPVVLCWTLWAKSPPAGRWLWIIEINWAICINVYF